MKQQEIQERNEQIQKMLRWELIHYPKNEKNFIDYYMFVKKDENGNKIDIFDYDDSNGNTIPFNLDWNWLMEAVEFIENKLKESYNVDIANKNQCEIVKNGDKYICGHGFETVSHSKQEAVFISVSNFAKLYNNNKL
jgi:hypothetical protein